MKFIGVIGGARRDRTDDLVNAVHAADDSCGPMPKIGSGRATTGVEG
jgi:hypothetical protein